MAYNQNTNFDNERKYLENLIAGGGGNGAWAQNQLAELNKAEKQYGTPTSTANNYYPERGGTGSIPKGSASSVNVGAGKITAPNGDELALHDWSKDTTDYSTQMQNAKTIEEFRKAAQARENKANAQGIDIYGGGPAKTNEQIYNEWAAQNNHNPSYGDFIYGGQGVDWQGNEGWIQNAGTAKGYYGMDASGNWGYYADPGLTQKLDNGNWAQSSDGGPVILDERGHPDMTTAGRDMSRAGQTVIMTGNGSQYYKVTYGENGYITGWSRLDTNHVDGLKMASAANNGAGVTGRALLKQQTGHTYVGPGATITQDQVRVGTPAQYQQVMAARGASPQDTTRTVKAYSTAAGGAVTNPMLEKYNTDDVYKQALDYISMQGAPKTSLTELEAELRSLYAANGAMGAAADAEYQAKLNAVKNAIARLEGQKTDVNNSYDMMQRMLYINREKNQKNIQQQMAAAGLTGGAAESTLLGLRTSYEEGLRKGEQERAKVISDIEQGIADTQASGDVEAARTLYERAKANTDSYAAALQTLMAQQNAREERAAEERKNAQNRAYALALSMLESGVMPSSDILATAGLDTETAQSIKGATESSSKIYSAQQFDIALNAAVNGNRDESIRRIIEGYSGMPMESVLAAYGYAQSMPVQVTYTPTYTPSYTSEKKASYNNGSLTTEQVKQMQQDINRYLPANQQIPVDGYWGAATQAAAGGASADEYLAAYYATHSWSGRNDR